MEQTEGDAPGLLVTGRTPAGCPVRFQTHREVTVVAASRTVPLPRVSAVQKCGPWKRRLGSSAALAPWCGRSRGTPRDPGLRTQAKRRSSDPPRPPARWHGFREAPCPVDSELLSQTWRAGGLRKQLKNQPRLLPGAGPGERTRERGSHLLSELRKSWKFHLCFRLTFAHNLGGRPAPCSPSCPISCKSTIRFLLL